MKISAELLSSLIQDIYAAAAEPSLWPAFLRRLEEVTNSSRSYMHAIRNGSRSVISVENNFGLKLENLSAQEYALRDELVIAYEVARLQAGGTFLASTSVFMQEAGSRALEAHQEDRVPMDDAHLCAMFVGEESGAGSISLGLRRAKNQSAFDSETLSLLTQLAPHVRQAVSLQRRLGELTDRAAVFEGSVDAFGVAVLSVDGEGQVRSVSSRAQTLLAGSNGVRLRNGRFVAERTADDARLQCLLLSPTGLSRTGQQRTTPGSAKRCAPESSRTADSTVAAGGCMRIARKPPEVPLYVSVCPVLAERSNFAASRLAALVFLGDSTVSVAGRIEVLRELCGTTATESRIADLLLQGREIKQMQDTLQLSTDSIRFHLKGLFRKTGTGRQSDLIRLLLTLPAIAY